MKVMGLPMLYTFCQGHADCEQQMRAWIAEAKDAGWKTPNDIKARYGSASFLADNRVVFNIKGNSYRLDAKVYYKRQMVIIKRVGTHSEYNGWTF